MVSSLVLLIFQFLFGSFIYRFVDRGSRLNRYEAVIASFVLGLVASSFLILSILLITTSWSMSLLIFWVVMLMTGCYEIWWLYRNRVHIGNGLSFTNTIKDIRRVHVFLFFFLSVYIFVLLGVLWIRENDILVAVYAAWGDTAYHLDMISRLRYSDPFILIHPVLAGERLTYPFLVNLLSALYQRTGSGVLFAWHVPVLVFGVSFVLLVYLFGKRLFLGSRASAVALVVLLLYGSGTGFLWYFDDIKNGWEDNGAASAIRHAVNPPKTYTNLDVADTRDTILWPVNIKWIVPAISFFSHQRSFIPGIALAILLFMGIRTTRGSPHLWRWGIVWGMIPMVHVHTFIAVSIVMLCWFLTDIKHWRYWILSGITAALMVFPQLFVLVPDILLSPGDSSFIRFSSGWVACKTTTEWLSCIPPVTVFESVYSWLVWFWTVNFGLLFWVWLASLIVLPLVLHFRNPRLNIRLNEYVVPGVVLFIVPNIVLFQPWDFDNNKILLYWWFFASVTSIYFLTALVQNRKLYVVLLVFFVFLSSFSGLIEVMNRFSEGKSGYYNYYEQHHLLASEWIKQNTKPNDIFLTGDQPTQFIPMLTGRPIYLGYHGWLWSQGKDELAKQRSRKAGAYLSTGNTRGVCDDGVKFLLWDESLLATYPDSNFDRILSTSEELYVRGEDKKLIRILRIECGN